MNFEFGVQTSYSVEISNYGYSKYVPYDINDFSAIGSQLCEYLGLYTAHNNQVGMSNPDHYDHPSCIEELRD